MIVITGKARLKPGAKEDLIEPVRRVCELSRAEEGCLEYRFGFDLEDDQLVTLHEEWESEEALAAHMAQPHFADFAPVLMGALEPGGEFTKWTGAERGRLF